MDKLVQELVARKIRPSIQRVKILEYLINNRIHPTADQIFQHMQKEIPTMSKATVYNTLNTFLSVGLVRLLTIGGSEARYDINTTTHGHFKCESCGTVHDFTIDLEDCELGGLDDFTVEKRDVHFRGYCPRCSSNPGRSSKC